MRTKEEVVEIATEAGDRADFSAEDGKLTIGIFQGEIGDVTISDPAALEAIYHLIARLVFGPGGK